MKKSKNLKGGVSVAKEKQFENKVKKYLEEQGCYPLGTPRNKMTNEPCGYYVKRWGGGRFTKSGLPDLQIVFKGIGIDVELKADDGRPSELQLHNLKQIDTAGSYAILLYPDQFEVFKDFIQSLKMGDDDFGRKYNYRTLKARWLSLWITADSGTQQ